MTFTSQAKRSASPYVEVVWRTEDQTDGVYVASADVCWADLLPEQGREIQSVLLRALPQDNNGSLLHRNHMLKGFTGF